MRYRGAENLGGAGGGKEGLSFHGAWTLPRGVRGAMHIHTKTHLTTLGVANNRLYQLRLQTDAASYDHEQGQVDSIRQSFAVFTVEEPKQN